METKAVADVGTVKMLGAEHRSVFEQALLRILHTDLAEETYAEILDGMPTSASCREFNRLFMGHPAMDHPELCPGSLERTREFRSSFDIDSLEFPLVPLLAFGDAGHGSKSFHLRLIELLARACHQIASYLYHINGHNHHHAEYERWRDEPRQKNPWDFYRASIAFTHGSYDAVDQYPNGLGDVVGYWAEAKIFGGTVVFDRGESDNECRDVYIHSRRRNAPRTIFPPTQEQLDGLLHFLLDKNEGIEEEQGSNHTNHTLCPLPILATLENRWRWDPWDAIAKFHIFRDKYERRVPDTKPDTGRLLPKDWPELHDELLIVSKVADRRDGLPVDEAEVKSIKERMKMITPSSPLWKSQTEPPSPSYVHVWDEETGEYSVQDLSETAPFSY